MEVTGSDIAGVPSANIRAPREEFVAVWRAASVRDQEQGASGTTDWYAAGVAVTCRWMAGAPTRSANGRGGLTRSPATRRLCLAYEELIEAECLAAELLDERRPEFVASRPGWSNAVRATLRWAWRREGPPPIETALPAPG